MRSAAGTECCAVWGDPGSPNYRWFDEARYEFIYVDREAHDARWARIRADEKVSVRTILVGDRVAGHVASFPMDGKLEVTYWIDRQYWGSGFGTTALGLFLSDMTERPLHARAAKDNFGSIRILEKCGFQLVGEERGFANARDQEIDEVVMRLD